MINLTDMDYRFADHTARVERVNANGWKWDSQGSVGARRGGTWATTVGQLRTSLGEAMVRVGGRVKGMPSERAANPGAGAYSTLDAVR